MQFEKFNINLKNISPANSHNPQSNKKKFAMHLNSCVAKIEKTEREF